MPNPPRSCDRLDDDHMTTEVHRRWGGGSSYTWSRFMGEHCAHERHKITKDSVKVLAREDIWSKRKVREAIKIKIEQPAMNRDQVYELPPPPIYDELLLSCPRRSHDLGGLGT